MTRTEIERMHDIIEAWLEGDRVQLKHGRRWITLDPQGEPAFDFTLKEYRIAPARQVFWKPLFDGDDYGDDCYSQSNACEMANRGKDGYIMPVKFVESD